MSLAEPAMPTSEGFQSAFTTLLRSRSKRVENGFRMLRENYRSPGRTISVARLASAAGYDNYGSASDQYGWFAHKVADSLGLESLGNVNGQARWTVTICTPSTKPDESGYYKWTLRPEVAAALEALKLVERVEFPDALADIQAAAGVIAGLGEKTRDAYVQARIGQGVFRAQLVKHWRGCAVTRFPQVDLCVASHPNSRGGRLQAGWKR